MVIGAVKWLTFKHPAYSYPGNSNPSASQPPDNRSLPFCPLPRIIKAVNINNPEIRTTQAFHPPQSHNKPGTTEPANPPK